jgi:hypothetical protein
LNGPSSKSALVKKERAVMERRIAHALNASAFIRCNKIDKKCHAIDYAFSFDRTHLPSTNEVRGQIPEQRPSLYDRQFAPVSSTDAFRSRLPESTATEGMAHSKPLNVSTASAVPPVRVAHECGPSVDYLIADYVYGRIVPVAAPSACSEAGGPALIPRRGLVLLSKRTLSRHDLDTTILPYLEECCNLSFDAIGSGFLMDAVAAERQREEAEAAAAQKLAEEQGKRKAMTHDSNHGGASSALISWQMLFFVRDDALLQIERSGPVTRTPHRSTRVSGTGALMSSNLRFLETLRSAVQVCRSKCCLFPIAAFHCPMNFSSLPSGPAHVHFEGFVACDCCAS